jgi:hypothetical protein
MIQSDMEEAKNTKAKGGRKEGRKVCARDFLHSFVEKCFMDDANCFALASSEYMHAFNDSIRHGRSKKAQKVGWKEGKCARAFLHFFVENASWMMQDKCMPIQQSLHGYIEYMHVDRALSFFFLPSCGAICFMFLLLLFDY